MSLTIRPTGELTMFDAPEAPPAKSFGDKCLSERWFYEQDGVSKGPVDRDALDALVAEGAIGPNTRVWTDSFGAKWRNAIDTDLGACIQDNRPPPIVDNKWAWMLAALPIMEAIADVGIGTNNGGSYTFIRSPVLWWFVGLLIARADFVAYRNLIMRKSDKYNFVFLSLTIAPVYLYIRNRRLKAGYATLWAWFISLVIACIIILVLKPE